MHAVGGVPASAVAAGRRDARAPRVSRSRRALALRRRARLGAVADARAGSDARTWRVRQVYGDGKVLLDQLREVADLLAIFFQHNLWIHIIRKGASRINQLTFYLISNSIYVF